MTSEKQSIAETARLFVTQQYQGVLSTHSVKAPGYPFGSLVLYDVTTSGEIVIYISLIAEHYKNLSNNPCASLIAVDPFAGDDPQAYGRCTLLLDFTQVREQAHEAVQSAYEQRFPNSFKYEIAHNFVFMLGKPKKIRWIAGFGEMGWLDGEAFCKVTPDPVAYMAKDVISHMHKDHSDAILTIALAYGAPKDCKELRMSSVDRHGFTLRYLAGPKRSEIKVPFPSELKSADDTRNAMIEVLASARVKLGA